MTDPIRVAGVLVGDMQSQPDMRVKYGAFFEALSRRFELVDVYNASLQGVARYWNALMTFQPSLSNWKSRFFKNPHAFQWRSQQTSAHLMKLKSRVDVILQLGALLDPTAQNLSLPVVVYTDNTTQISARRPNVGRMAFTPRELKQWMANETRLYKHASHICVRSSVVRNSLLDDYHILPSCVSVVGGGVNFSPLPERVQRKDGRPPVVLFIGEGFYRKGGDLLLRAFELARQRVPSAELWIVTGDSMPKGFALDHVRVFPPTWDREVVANLYRQADIFVLPSRLETWGDVLLEAMAFGLPCVGVRGQAMEDIIQDGETGLLIDNEQTNGLAGSLVRLLGQPAERRRMGDAARLRVENYFTWDHVVERLAPALIAAVYH